jgi:hypothetical protein
MLPPEDRATIDALSPDELEYEFNRGRRSRFQGEKFAYLQTRRQLLNDEKADEARVGEAADRRRTFGLQRVSTWITVITSVATLALGGGWYQEHQENERAQLEANQRLVAEYLQPVATLLEDNEVIFKELRAPPYVEPGWGILESYLIKIRRDGVAKHALMKKRIDTLVANNDTIITLLNKYAAYVKTPEFRAESAKFRDHAIRYSDRWKSLLEVYASKGEFPTAAPVFPAEFPAAVQLELRARRGEL